MTTSQPGPLIKLQNISRHFHTDSVETRAVNDISLAINEGEYVSIAGPSGCGKSTLLSIIGLLDSPTSGEYLLNGHAAMGLDAYQRAALRNKEIGSRGRVRSARGGWKGELCVSCVRC